MTRLRIILAAAVACLTLMLASCGGSSGGIAFSGGGSGIGGTGITFVKGNVLSIDGQTVTWAPNDPIQGTLAGWMILASFAQTIHPTDITVSGGNRSVQIGANGLFELAGVEPSNAFTLVFSLPDGTAIPLAIGQVPDGSTVTVVDIVLDTSSQTASSGGTVVEENEDDDSSDDNSSEEEGSEDEDSSEDNGSEDDDSEDTDDDDDDDSSEDGGGGGL